MCNDYHSLLENRLMLAFYGTELPGDIRSVLQHSQVSGFTLFGPPNYESPEQVYRLTSDIQAIAKERGLPRYLIATDQEGGQLNAMGEGATQFTGNMALGAAGDPELAENVGRAIGQELAAMGVNINYAPICDLNTNPYNPSLGIRAFSDQPELTGQLAAAMVRGIQSAGVAATLKHFPGKGAALVDSHFSMPLIDHSRERLDSVELPPFKQAIDAGAKLVMTGHFAIPSITGSTEVPATLSKSAMHDLVRHDLGFNGVVITDALDMGAISQGAGQIIDVIAAVRAQVDLLLLMPDPEMRERLDAGLKLAYTRGLIEDHHLLDSAERVNELRLWVSQFEQPSLDVVGSDEHLKLADQLAERSLTLVRNDEKLLPLRLSSDDKVLVVVPKPKNLTPADLSFNVRHSLRDAMLQYHTHVDELMLSFEPDAEEISIAKMTAAKYDLLVLGTINASMYEDQAALVRELYSLNIPTIVIAMRIPYDIAVYPQVGTYLCTYSIQPAAMKAAAKALFGKINPTGKLPVTIPEMYEFGHGLSYE